MNQVIDSYVPLGLGVLNAVVANQSPVILFSPSNLMSTLTYTVGVDDIHSCAYFAIFYNYFFIIIKHTVMVRRKLSFVPFDINCATYFSGNVQC